MRILFSLLLMILVGGLAVAGFVFLIAKSIGQMALSPGSKAWERSVQRLRERIRPMRGQLVPWEGETLALLSLNRGHTTKPGFFGGGEKTGIFNTIYQEPVLAYATQRMGRTNLVLAQTSDREYVLRIKEKETDIYLNGQPLGIYSNGNLLAPGRSAQLLAKVDVHADETFFPLQLRDQSAAALANPAKSSGPNPRALTLLRELSPEEEAATLAMAILQMVRPV